MHFFEWLQNTWWASKVDDSVPIAVVFEIMHYFSMFLLVGSIAFVDLRLMGIAGRRRSIADISSQFFPVMWMGMALNFFSGFVMFASDATTFVPNWVFHIKLTVIFLAVVFGIIVQFQARKWGQEDAPPVPAWGKALALISLLLWIGSILASVEVPSLTDVG
jgi:uncharacterized membrane protein